MEYYAEQAGSGLSPYVGIRFQKGHGFFGRIIKGAVPLIKQLLPYLGKKALDTGVSIFSDVYNRKDPRSSRALITDNLRKTAGAIADDALVKVKTKLKGQMKGEGIKRRVRRTKAAPRKTTKRRKVTKKRKTTHKVLAQAFLNHRIPKRHKRLTVF